MLFLNLNQQNIDWREEWDPRIVFKNAVAVHGVVRTHYLNTSENGDSPVVTLGKGIYLYTKPCHAAHDTHSQERTNFTVTRPRDTIYALCT